MSAQDFEVIVIGSGPAGEGAAMQAAKARRRVALIERASEVGGGCTHWGTIPSKALRHAVQRVLEFRSSPLFSRYTREMEWSIPELLQSSAGVVAKQTFMRREFYERNHVAVFQGQACFLDPHHVAVRAEDGHEEILRSDSFVIATGSHPYRPADIDFQHPRVFDSDTILSLGFTPQSISIYGAGVIGCEYASMFRGFGIKVNLINQRDKLLAFLDDEIIDALSYHLRDQGVIIRHNEEYERVEPLDDGVILHLRSGKKLKTDLLLWANGRTGNSQGLGLESLGIQANHRGTLIVDENYRTSVSHIYAAGDIIGPPGLASASYAQGRAAAQYLANGSFVLKPVQQAPSGIYTSPEISCIGATERQLTEAKIPYEVGHSLFRSLARAQITGQTVGMLKLLFHRETMEILGIHCFGDQASEIIHIGQAVMASSNNSLEYFIETTFNYPTMAEAYRVAALNGKNRLF